MVFENTWACLKLKDKLMKIIYTLVLSMMFIIGVSFADNHDVQNEMNPSPAASESNGMEMAEEPAHGSKTSCGSDCLGGGLKQKSDAPSENQDDFYQE